jgi:hypothetical protein
MPENPISELDIAACVDAVQHHSVVRVAVKVGLDIIHVRDDLYRLTDLLYEDLLLGACATFGNAALLAVIVNSGSCAVFDVTLPWHMHDAGADHRAFWPKPLVAEYVREGTIEELDRILKSAYAYRQS